MLFKMLSNVFLLCLVSLCDITITSSKKIRLPDYSRKSTLLDECGRCKVLTDSFNHWIEKTSRGKYEGGDTAWEEAKLKSYARSEIRLVEIQEGLCSELTKYQDYCYILSEEAEQLLEKWWFHEDYNLADLYTWLCIENLKYCCPINHFGDTCVPCHLDKNNLICSGHGKCDGDGTREGNGTCICSRGYTGENCKDCAENYFSESDGSCEQCHVACSGCSGGGPSACTSCKPGWQQESGFCVDIDECLSLTNCRSNELCVNNVGSFQCKACHISCNSCAGLGAKNCTSCKDLNVLWDSMCITRKELDEIITYTKKRLGLYIALVIIMLLIINYRIDNKLGPILSIFIGVLMIYLEATSKLNTLDVVHNLYQNFNHNQSITDLLTKFSKFFW